MEPNIVIKFLGGQCPMQAEGTINGHPFFFHARWDGWAFSISLDPNVDVVGMSSSRGGFYVEGNYGKPNGYDAGYMPEEDAEVIIHKCAKQFVAQHPAQATPDYELERIPNLTGWWLGTTQGYSTPNHLWHIEQKGRFLSILGTLQDDEGGPKPKMCLLGRIVPEEALFLLLTGSGEHKAHIHDANAFTVSHWVVARPDALTNYNYGKIDQEPEPNSKRYSVAFARQSA